MSDNPRIDASPATPDEGRAAARKPYCKPELVEYGDIARLTETGGPSIRDGTGPRKQKG